MALLLLHKIYTSVYDRFELTSFAGKFFMACAAIFLILLIIDVIQQAIYLIKGRDDIHIERE